METLFLQDHAPQNEIVRVEPLTPDEIYYLKATDSEFFASEADLKDIAAGVALKGLPIESALDEVRAGYMDLAEVIQASTVSRLLCGRCTTAYTHAY